MPLYQEAQTPGSSFPGIAMALRDRLSHPGVVLPPNSFVQHPTMPQMAPNSTRALVGSLGNASPPATQSLTPYSAEISKSFALGPSVVGTLVDATPVATVRELIDGILNANRRPLIPIGLRERAADAMPPGMRKRAAAWTRAVARFQSPRPTAGGRVNRE